MGIQSREDGKKFLDEYLDAHIGRGTRRYYTITPVSYAVGRMWDEASMQEPIRQVEESVDISLRQADYEKLLEILGFFNERGNADGFAKHAIDQASYERSLRKAHPGLQKAYDKYQMLLSLVSNGKDIDFD